MIRRWSVRKTAIVSVVAAVLALPACQNPNDPSDTVDYSEALEITVAPDPIEADTSTGGKTYRVVRGNNQPDELLPYDWHAVFSSTLVLNDKASNEDLDLDFPLRITGATLTVKQATGGIITPPGGTEKEAFEYVPLAASGNQFPGIASPITLSFEVWYDLPSLRKESVVTLSYSFVDNDGTSFSRSVDFKVAP
ncbi:MAG: hypothetical protein EHM55_18475 [Acidobacteria bacterium]|nr:MAG: hypothetical protein EHM55_18475 [Acidobacteriota bacterium]